MKYMIKLSMALAVLSATVTNAEELEPITIISANKTLQDIEETTSKVTVITAEEIEERGYHSVAEAMNTVSGISVVQLGGLGQQSSFFVRGADSGKTVVLLDGMRLNDPSTTNGTALLDTLTTGNIERIEIIKGGMNTVWGTSASAGVINIITKSPKMGTHGSLSLIFGSHQTRGVDADIAYKDEKLSAQLLATYLDTDGISALAPKEAENDTYTNKNVNVKWGYTFDEKNRVQLSYNAIKTDTEYDDPYSAAQADDDYSIAGADQKNVALKYDFNSGNYQVDMYASQGEYERIYYTTGFYGDGVNVYKAKLKEYTLVNSYDYAAGKAVLGLEYKDIDGFNQYNDFPSSQADYTNKALFLSNLYRAFTGTMVETNLRYDNFDQFENKMTFKLGVKHEHHNLPGFGVSVNYYTAYDAPSSYQLANVVFGTVLKPTFTKGYELSMHYKEFLNVTYFENEVEESIDYDMVNYGYYNIEGVSRFKGLEVESRYKLETVNLDLAANYTYLFEATKEDGSDLLRRPKETLNLSANYYTEHSTYGITMAYTGKRKDIKYNPDYTTSEISTGNYTLWNLNYARELGNDLKLIINAKNILDKAYQSVYGYATEGRSLYAKIRYSF